MSKKTYTDLDLNNTPEHIAVIMDGNGRWATNKGMPRLAGHRQGYLALKDLVDYAVDFNIKYITVYAFSSENWKRPKDEVKGLMKLIKYAAKVELNKMKREDVRIIVSGRINELPESLQKQFMQDMEETKDNSRVTLNIAVNYGGRNEIIDATRQAAQMVLDGKITAEEIDDKLFTSLLYHPEIPDPDLVIRTAGELRISNFLLWQTAYAEIFVTDTLWPDFKEETLVEAIRAYQKRVRKFGKVVEPVKG